MKRSSGVVLTLWMPISEAACLWASCPVTRAPQSAPAAAKRGKPRLSVINRCQRSAMTSEEIPALRYEEVAELLKTVYDSNQPEPR